MSSGERPTKILIGPSFSILDTDKRVIHNAVAEALSFYAPNYWFSPKFRSKQWDGRIKFLRNDGAFMTGLLGIVEKALRRKFIPYKVYNRLWTPMTVDPPDEIGGFRLRQHDKDVLVACFRHGRGLVNLAGGAGKTAIEAELARLMLTNFGGRALVLTGNVQIYQQFVSTFKRVCEPVLKVSCARGAKKNFAGDVVVTTSQTMASCLKHNRAVLAPFLDTITLLIVDEAQFIPAKTWMDVVVRCRNCYCRFGFSGTIETGDVIKDVKMVGATGSEIIKRDTQNLVDKGIITEPVVLMVDLVNEKKFVSRPTWPDEYNTLVVNNKLRNEVALQLLQSKYGVMVITESVEHGQRLAAESRKRGRETWFLCGDDPDTKRKQVVKQFSLGKGQLVATRIFSTGFDTSAIDVLVVLSGFKAQVSTIQRLWRAVRLGNRKRVLIVDFIDDGKYLLEHSRLRVGIYQNHNLKILVRSVHEFTGDISLIIKTIVGR